MADKVVFSGIQPTGNLHIGNYLGAVKRWVEGQEDGINLFCIVDMHAITTKQDPERLRQSSLDMAALLIASGLDPKRVILFIQSQNPDHANLAWILNCNISMGQMSRMTQFKEKSEQQDFVSVGLFDYPALMASDILLYNTTEVPVGEDQVQHIELTRDVAKRFNSRYGETFVLPKAKLPKSAARIMSLVNPTKKMSKSDKNNNSRINVVDREETIIKKINSAVTDSDNKVIYDRENKAGISNLLEIYSSFSDKTIKESETEFAGINYGKFKEAVAEVVISGLRPIQKRYQQLQGSGELSQILEEGAQKAREISSQKLKEVYQKIGLAG